MLVFLPNSVCLSSMHVTFVRRDGVEKQRYKARLERSDPLRRIQAINNGRNAYTFIHDNRSNGDGTSSINYNRQ